MWEKLLDLATLASQAGWEPDSIKNLIALPANEAAQAKMAAEDGFILPIHDSSHPTYDKIALGFVLLQKAKYGEETPTPAEARAIFEAAAMKMRGQIMTGTWMPKLR